MNKKIKFKPKSTKNKVSTGYKSLYISDKLVEEIDEIANKYNTSFNNVVVSMIEIILKENESHQSWWLF